MANKTMKKDETPTEPVKPKTTRSEGIPSTDLLACRCGTIPVYVETYNGLYKYRLECPQCCRGSTWMSVKKIDAVENWNEQARSVSDKMLGNS